MCLFSLLFHGEIPRALLSPCQEEEAEYLLAFANWKFLCYIPSLQGRNNIAALDWAGAETPAERRESAPVPDQGRAFHLHPASFLPVDLCLSLDS